ncbi:MAG: hypothetical protein G01um101431_513 [Parcubacteria group bacterium Gr01-1014_31]|nr:MAG: hypothetical protein G01um101431_513 [Parcubacteria group bacterium Gr01-1014_31]
MCTTSEPTPTALRGRARQENLAGINRRLSRPDLSPGKRAKLEVQRRLLRAAIERSWIESSSRPYQPRQSVATR